MRNCIFRKEFAYFELKTNLFSFFSHMIFLRLKSIFQRWSTNILYRSPTFSIKISETIVGFEKTSGSDW